MLQFRPRYQVSSDPIGDLPPWLSTLLRARGVDNPEAAERFLHPDLSMLYDPFRMQCMDRAVAILRQAQADGTPVQVYGDYDCDGVTATAIMMETFREMGVRADWRIPSRHSEGYGLNCDAVREMAKEHQILLTVDCGITNHEEVLLAQRLGMTVIVTDHHQLAETPSPADVVLNPLCGDYPFRRLCGAGVALKLTQALLGMEAVERRVELAAIATIADIVPLVDENRVIVSEGLRRLRTTSRPGLQCLMARAGLVPNQPVNAGQVAFRLAPRINAGGRLEDAGQCVELLLTTDRAQADALALHLEENNSRRQAMQEEMTAAAETAIRETIDFYSDRVIIVMGAGWNSGVIGLAAGRICEKYHYPAIVLSQSADGLAVGSCRSIKGVNIHRLLTRCSDLFLRFGGHEQAAGLTMRAELVPELRRRLNLYIDEDCSLSDYIPCEEYDLPLRLEQVDLHFIQQLELMQPTGFGNPAPVFLTSNASVQEMRPVGREGSHLRLSLLDGQAVRGGIAFQQGHLAARGYDRVDVLYAPEKNEYRDQISAQLQVKALKPASGLSPLPGEEALLSGLVQCITRLAEQSETAAVKMEAITSAAVTRLCADGLGVLLLSHERNRAETALRENALDVHIGAVEDMRPFNTLLLNPDYDRLRDSWRHIVLLDGDLLPGEAELLRQRCPRATLHAMRPNLTLKERLSSLRMERETLLRLYQALRPFLAGSDRRCAALAEQTGLTPLQVNTGLTIFSQLQECAFTLTPWTLRLLPIPKPAPKLTDSALYRWLNQDR